MEAEDDSSDSDFAIKPSGHGVADDFEIVSNSGSEDRQKIATLKRNLSANLMNQSVKNSKINKITSPGSGFTRFSMKYYFDVLANLSPHQKKVIDQFAKFAVGNKCTGKKSMSLGGCIYYLAVCYLDFVDFGATQVADGFPRICVWKGDMIRSYSQLDEIRESVYGKRPWKSFSSTCYNQIPTHGVGPCSNPAGPSDVQVFDFRKNLDEPFGNIFPQEIQIDVLDEEFEFHLKDIDAKIEKAKSSVTPEKCTSTDEVEVVHEKKCNAASFLRPLQIFKGTINLGLRRGTAAVLHHFSSVLQNQQCPDGYHEDVPYCTQQSPKSTPACGAGGDPIDITSSEELPDVPSPDKYPVAQVKFSKKCAQLCGKAEAMYNGRNVHNSDLPSSHGASMLSVPAMSSANGVATASTSGGKLHPHGPGRAIYPPKGACGPFVTKSKMYPVGAEARRYYFVLCKLGSTKYSDDAVFRLNKVHVTYKSLAESLCLNGHVDNILVAAYCRKFSDEVHPSKSRKHQLLESMLHYQPQYEMPLVKKAFEGAPVARKLHLCDLFVVDIKDRLFVFIDSLYSKVDEYQVYVNGVDAFKELWSRFNGNNPLPFDEFRVVYPATPKQKNLLMIVAVFMLMFLGLWNSPRVCLPNLITAEDIPNIRMFLVNELFFSPLYLAYKSFVPTYTTRLILEEAEAKRCSKALSNS
ncbi:hypothetical protein ACP4OV_010706 [Aristida adscensionis]